MYVYNEYLLNKSMCHIVYYDNKIYLFYGIFIYQFRY